MSCLVAEPHAAALGRGRANPAASSSAAPSQRSHGTPRRGGAESPRRSSTEQTGENHTHTQGHVMQQSTSDSGRRRSGGGGGGASLTRASAGRLASGPCLRRCEDGRGRLRQAGDHHVHDGSDYPVRGVCAKRLSSNLTTYRLETACTTTRTLPECNCHCFPCLLCVPRLETCTLGCPPPRRKLGVA